MVRAKGKIATGWIAGTIGSSTIGTVYKKRLEFQLMYMKNITDYGGKDGNILHFCQQFITALQN